MKFEKIRSKKYFYMFHLFVFLVLIKYLLFNYKIVPKIIEITTNEKLVFVFPFKMIIFIIMLSCVILLFQSGLNRIFRKYEIKMCVKSKKIVLNKLYYLLLSYINSLFFVLSIIYLIMNINVYKYLIPSKNWSPTSDYFLLARKTNLLQKSSCLNSILTHNLFVFPEPVKYINLKIDTGGQTLPETKDDGELNVNLNMEIDGLNLTTYGTIKVQGSSTSGWPKKNWTIMFYKDEIRKEELKIKIGDSLYSNYWIAKAEWIDPTMLRNHLSYELWNDITQNRKSDKKMEINNSNKNIKGARGFPNTFPIAIYLDGSFYGLSLLMLGHDPNNFNIDGQNERHLYFEFDSRHPGFDYPRKKSWQKLVSYGIGTWIDGYVPANDSFTLKQKAAIDQFGLFVNSPLTDFTREYDKYLDKYNIIDMLLYQEIIYDWDGYGADLEIVTYDLTKWYILPWDKDTTFGLNYNETGLIENSENKKLFNYKKEQEDQIIWFKTYKTFTKEVEQRYSDLRKNGVFSVDNLKRKYFKLYNMIPDEIWQSEREKWPYRPSVDETSPEQILDWFGKRLEMLDKHFNYKK